jgi:hypothetical protein
VNFHKAGGAHDVDKCREKGNDELDACSQEGNVDARGVSNCQDKHSKSIADKEEVSRVLKVIIPIFNENLFLRHAHNLHKGSGQERNLNLPCSKQHLKR